MAVTASSRGGLTGSVAPAAQSVHFGHSPFSQAAIRPKHASSVFRQKQREECQAVKHFNSRDYKKTTVPGGSAANLPRCRRVACMHSGLLLALK